MTRLRARLSQEGTLIADGATGTLLQKAGLPPGTAPDRWNLENPDAIRTMYKGYVDAGSDLILTNTFGSNRLRLEGQGLHDQVREVNMAAAQLAREAAGERVMVVGDLGPTGHMFAPFGDLSHEDAVSIYKEQASILVEAGVDGLLIETMSDLNEAKAAVEGARMATSLPVMVTMSFDTHGRTMMGVKPEDAASELWAMGADAVGANCGRTLSENLDAIQKMREILPDAVLIAKPNAGLPRVDDEDVVYDVTPQVMADYARQFAALGVRIIGGCCGSTPEHIKAIARALA
jgi:5-methyltetrahydrofolate--homocysteine methyltransferase